MQLKRQYIYTLLSIPKLYAMLNIVDIQSAINKLGQVDIDTIKNTILNPVYGFVFDRSQTLSNLLFSGPQFTSNFLKDETSKLRYL